MSDNIQVVVKVRPLIKREKDAKLKEEWKINGNSIQSFSVFHQTPFYFDHIFGPESSNGEVFSTVADPIVQAALKGYNGTIFAYGQTSSGKTHTMMGDDIDPGIMIMAVRQLFREVEASSDREFMIRVGYIEIYNEKVYDLLDKRTVINIREARNSDIELQNKEVLVNNEGAVFEILNMGNKVRSAAFTKMNTLSSRSHAILRIIIESGDKEIKDGAIQVSYLNLVDLAGSERADQAETTGSRLKEGGHINKSLLSLSCVIQKLSEGDTDFINYRDSKLTRILQASLGGNSNTAIICNVTPAVVEETYFTLSFANRAKTVKNKAICNEVYSDEALMKKMRSEIQRLQAELKSMQTKQDTKSLRERIEKEICEKQSQFLSANNRIKTDRRQTWHYEIPAGNFDSTLMPPPPSEQRFNLGRSKSKSSLNGEQLPLLDFDSLNINSNRGTDFSSPLSVFSSPTKLNTPKILRPVITQCFSPSPNKNDLRFQMFKLEDDFAELKEFTSVERVVTDVDVVKRLEEELKMAQEQLKVKSQEQWDLVHEKLNKEFTCSSCSQVENQCSSNANGMDAQVTEKISALLDEKSSLEIRLNKLSKVNEENLQLIQKFEHVKSTNEHDIKLLNQEMKSAKLAQEKAEIMHAEGEITFSQYKVQSDRRIKELISEIDSLKDQVNAKTTVDFNISKIPIKTEYQDYSYEITELKSELDQLKTADESKLNEIRSLESKLQSITEEKNVLQSEHTEMSTQIMEQLDDIENMKSKLSTNEAEIENLRDKIVADVKELEELRSINNANDDSLTKQKDTLCRLERENTELRSRLTEMSAATEQATAESSEQEAMMCKVIIENASLKQQNSFLSDKLVVLEPFKAKNDILMSSVQELEIGKAKISGRLEELQSKFHSLKNLFGKSAIDSNRKIVALSLVIEHLNQSNDRHNQTEINETNAALTEMTTNYSSAKQTILDMEDEIEKLRSANTVHEHTIEKVIAEKLEIDEKCKELEQSLNKIEISAESRVSQHPLDEFTIYLSSLLQQFESQVFCQLSLGGSLQCKVETLEKLIKFGNIKRSVDKFIKSGNLKLLDLSDQIDCSPDEVDETIQKLKNRVNELEQQNSQHNSALEHETQLIDELLELSAKHSLCGENLEIVQKSLEDLTIQNSVLEANILTIKDNECKLNAINEHHVSELKTLKDNYSELKSKYFDLQSDYDASCSDTEKLQAIVDDNRLVIEQTEEECRTMKASFKSLMEETESLTATNSSLDTEIKDLKDLVEAKLVEISDLKSNMAELQHQNSLLNSKTESDQKLFEKLQELQAKHSVEMEAKLKDIKQLSEQLEVLQIDFSRNQMELETVGEEKSYLETEIRNIKLKNDNMNSQLSGVEKVKELSAQLEVLQTSLSRNQNELEIVSEQKSRLETEIKTIKLEKESGIKNLEDLLKTKSMEISELMNKIAEVEQENSLLKSKTESEQKLLEKLEELQQKHSVEMEAKLNDVKKLTTQLAVLQTELSTNRKELKTIYEQKSYLETEIKYVESEKESMNNQLSEIAMSLKNIEKEKLNLANELQLLSNQHVALKTKIDLDKDGWLNEKSGFEKVILKLKCDLLQKEQLLESTNSTVADFENQLRQAQVESKAAEELKSKRLKALTLEVNEFKEKYNTVTANYKLLKEQFDKLETYKNQMQSDLLDMKKHVAELEKKLEANRRNSLVRSNEILKNVLELDEQKKNQAIICDFKKTVNTDRKTRRRSQYDESRSLLDDTVIALKSTVTQTDPYTDACRCIAMDLKIKDLNRNLMVKEATINTLKLEMECHPLKGENTMLKRQLDDKKEEMQLLQLNVDHYKAKAKQNGHTCRECIDHNSKTSVDQQTQVDAREIAPPTERKLGPLAYHHKYLPQKYELAKREIKDLTLKLRQQNVEKLSNGEASSSQSADCNHSDLKQTMNELLVQKDVPSSSSNSVDEDAMQLHLVQIGALKEQIAALRQEHDKVTDKANMYKQLAISRRAKIKELEAASKQSSESNEKL